MTKSLFTIAQMAMDEYNGSAAIVVVIDKNGELSLCAEGLTFVGQMLVLSRAMNEFIALNGYKIDGKELKNKQGSGGKDAILS